MISFAHASLALNIVEMGTSNAEQGKRVRTCAHSGYELQGTFCRATLLCCLLCVLHIVVLSFYARRRNDDALCELTRRSLRRIQTDFGTAVIIASPAARAAGIQLKWDQRRSSGHTARSGSGRGACDCRCIVAPPLRSHHGVRCTGRYRPTHMQHTA